MGSKRRLAAISGSPESPPPAQRVRTSSPEPESSPSPRREKKKKNDRKRKDSLSFNERIVEEYGRWPGGSNPSSRGVSVGVQPLVRVSLANAGVIAGEPLFGGARSEADREGRLPSE
ncbi:hypothetical protein IMZ48_32185 [Candidatus Bathyarchaeota archaeon]|nr:hypothetical protein [Candidatus Bathyarchaeota archaeon]